MSLNFDNKRDTYICPVHGDVGDDTGWVQCCQGCDEGYFDEYEQDPMMYDPGDISTCEHCKGKGGFRVCGQCNYDNPDVER